MKIRMEINEETKTVKLLVDKVNGEHFTCFTADNVFDIEDKGYEIIPTNKDISNRLHEHRLAQRRIKK